MTLVFDTAFDHGSWPGPLAADSAKAGERWVGVLGLIGELETQLGLGGREVGQAERVAAIYPTVANSAGFWSQSAAVDPFGVAARLLHWRDTLRMHGWTTTDAGRLCELRSATALAPPGIPDRVDAIIDAIQEQQFALRSLRLGTPRDLLPKRLRDLLDALEAAGVALESVDLPSASRPVLELIRAPGPLVAANQIAAWLAAEGHSDTVIITTDTTPTLSVTAEPGSTVEWYIDGVLQGTSTANGTGVATFTITNALADGDRTVTSQATDVAGNTGPLSAGLTISVDTTAPGVASVHRQTPSAERTNADQVVFSVTFDEGVANVNTADFALTGTAAGDGTVNAVAPQSSSVYYVTITGLTSSSGTIGLAFAGGQDITDLAGTALANTTPGSSQTYTIDNTAPALQSFTRLTPPGSPVSVTTLVFRATFNEDVANVSTGDFSVNSTSGATIAGVSGSGSVYDVTVSGGLAGFNGTVGLDLAGGQDITDVGGNALPAGEPTTDELYTVHNAIDFGDAPASYGTLLAANGARHLAQGPRLGATRDHESDGSADDGADEDGVSFAALSPGNNATATVNVQVGAGKLNLWLDVNQDGSFGAGEQLVTDLAVAVGNNSVTIAVPATATLGNTFARVRLSTAGGGDHLGLAADGEVEDYPVTIVNIAPVAAADSASTNEDAALVANALSNDTDANPNDTLVFAAVDASSQAGVTVTTTSNGSFTYNPSVVFASLLSGQTGTDSFNYTVSDGTDTDVGTVSIIIHGASSDIAVSGTGNFGSADILTGSVSRSFTVSNTGNRPLVITGTSITGAQAADFQVTTPLPGSIAAGSNANLIVTFDPLATGARAASLAINSNDPDENPVTIPLSGTGTAVPEINVTGNGQNIAAGDTTPSTADDTDFGGVEVNGGTDSHTFTIQNTGSAPLAITSVQVTGGNAADFAIAPASIPSPIASTGSTTFTVTFDPGAGGTRSTTVRIISDDADEGTYDFALAGEGAVGGVITGTVFNDANASGTRDGGESGLGGVTITVTRTSDSVTQNTNTLADGSYTVSGLQAGDYTVVATTPAGQVLTTGNSPISVNGVSVGTTYPNNDFGFAVPRPFSFNLGSLGFVNLTLRCAGAFYEVRNESNVLIASVLRDAVTQLDIIGTSSANVYTIDFSAGCDPIPAGGINVVGQSPASDTLHFVGAPGGDHTYNYSNAHDGHVLFSLYGRVDFADLTPITNDGTAANVIFNIPTASNVEVVNHMNLGQNTIQSSPGTFETTTFNNPTNSLTINGSNGNDTFVITSLDPGFAATFTINGGSGTNTLLGNSTTNEFQITQLNIGQLLSDGNTYAFSNIQALTGTAADDTFSFLNGTGRLSGSVAGGFGTDTLSYSGYSTGAQVVIDGTAADGQYGREIHGTLNNGNANGFTGIELILGAGIGVPTLTEWGIILLTLLMAMKAYTRLRERMA
jgi:hypothetical protein